MVEKNIGFTLIEVLISLFILSLILLGFNGMLLLATQQTHAAYHFSIASQQMITMIERLHALGNAEGLEDQIITWNAQNRQLLPHGIGTITGSYPSYTVTLHWGKHCLSENITV